MQNWQNQFLLKPNVSIFEISVKYLSNLVDIGQWLITTQQSVGYDIVVNINKSHNY